MIIAPDRTYVLGNLRSVFMKRYDINDYFDFNRINNVSSIFKYSQIGDLNKNLVSPAFMVASKMASLNKSFVATKAAYLTSPTGILNEYNDKYIQKLHKDLIPKALPNIQNFNTGVISQKVIASFERVQKLTKIFERQLKGLTHISPVDVHNSIVPNGEIAVNLASEHWIMLLQDSKIDKELLNECKVAENMILIKLHKVFI